MTAGLRHFAGGAKTLVLRNAKDRRILNIIVMLTGPSLRSGRGARSLFFSFSLFLFLSFFYHFPPGHHSPLLYPKSTIIAMITITAITSEKANNQLSSFMSNLRCM